MTFEDKFEFQPHTFVNMPNSDCMFVASRRKAKLVNLRYAREFNLHTLYDIDDIAAATYDTEEDMMYLVAGRQNGLLGIHLVKFKPDSPKQYKFLSSFHTSLDIGDVTLRILRGTDPTIGDFKELVVAYKTIFMNTYTVHVEDLSGSLNKRSCLFRHSHYCLWEDEVTGLTVGSEFFV